MKKFLLITSLFCTLNLAAETTLKIATLAPDGTNWAETLKKLSKELNEKTDGEVKLKMYFGGSQGDEPDVLRKVRVGQLHGGIFTGKTLGDVNGDVRVMELPFTFDGNRQKALSTMLNMAPFFEKGFEKGQFMNLGFFEIGIVYFVSQKKTDNLEMLKGLKIWQWEGDDLVTTLIKEMNLVSVPLPLPDVLSSLTTGVVEAAYAPPMGIVALQWNTKIKYIVDFPLSYSIGAFLLSNKAWSSIPVKYQKIVKDTAQKCIVEANANTIKDNIDALAAMKTQGVEFLKFPDEDIKTAKDLRKKTISKLKGKLFSPDALAKLEKNLKG